MINNRWVVLIAVTLINVTTSYAYTWSVFSTPLMDLFGWTAAATAFVFTLTGLVAPFSQMLGGALLNRFGVRKPTFCAIIVLSVSVFAASYTRSIGWMYLTYGIVAAVGMAVMYICNLTNTLRFFDDRRGLASGIMTAGSGLSAVIIAPIAQFLITSFGVLPTFKIMGVAYIVILMILFLFIREAPIPAEAEEAADEEPSGGTQRSYTTLEMIRTGDFYVLLMLYAFGAIGGLMVISQTANMAMEMVGCSAAVAALAVSIVAVGNTIGRIIWGVISDYIGRYNTLLLIYIIMTALFILFNIFCRSSMGMFFAAIIMIGICYGGIPSMFPAFTLDRFGPKYNGMNYGCMFFGYSIGALVGPIVGAACKDMGPAPYSVGLIVSTLICIAGIVLSLVLKFKSKESI